MGSIKGEKGGATRRIKLIAFGGEGSDDGCQGVGFGDRVGCSWIYV